jgi:hypothetical protein
MGVGVGVNVGAGVVGGGVCVLVGVGVGVFVGCFPPAPADETVVNISSTIPTTTIKIGITRFIKNSPCERKVVEVCDVKNLICEQIHRLNIILIVYLNSYICHIFLSLCNMVI